MNKHPVFLLFLGVLALACLFGAWRPVHASPAVLPPYPIKIMPFGDSITTSVGNTTIFGKAVTAQASYRYWLDHDLHAANIPFEFIGTQIDNYGGPPKFSDFDHHHEAYSGIAAIDFITSSNAHYIDTLLNDVSYGTTTPNVPDIVLLHLGTNDLYQTFSPTETKDHLSVLIDHFRAKNPNVVIFLAQIIPCGPTNYYLPANPERSTCTKIPALNALIPGLAASKNTAASPVIVVDQYTGFNVTSDTYDGLHPDESGEVKMADKWMAAILTWWARSLPYQGYLPVVLK